MCNAILVDKVRAAAMKTSEAISRQRINELVQMQQRGSSRALRTPEALVPQTPDTFAGLSVSDLRDSQSFAENSQSVTQVTHVSLSSDAPAYREEGGVDAEIARLARRIRDRLMMPSAASAAAGAK